MTKDFVRLVKYEDELRLDNYVELYKEIAAIEMKLREVFTYIFYYRYSPNYTDILQDFEIKLKGDGSRPEVVTPRLENEFFFLLFKEYKILDTPEHLSCRNC